MKRIFSLFLVINLTWIQAGYGQFTTPAIDANFDGTGSYPSNAVSGSTTWYVTWNNTDLFVFLQNADETMPVSIFLDVDPIEPVNGGTNANGTLAGIYYNFYSNAPNLPFRADVLIYAYNGSREIFRRDGANGWTSLGSGVDGICGGGTDDYTGNVSGQYSSNDNGNGAGGDDRREFRISWSRLLGAINGGARPTSFNWLGYVSFNNGMYAQLPVENYNGFDVTANSNGIVRYYTVSSTENGTSTNPFSRNSYTHPFGSDNGAFGAISVWDFTMNSPGRTITRTTGSGGGWVVNGNLVVAAGTVSFGTSTTPAVIGTLNQLGGTLSLSASAGGDLQVAGNFSNNGTFTNNGRTVTFNGNGNQSITGNTTLGQIANTNIFGTVTVAAGTTIQIMVASSLGTAGSVLAVNGTLRCNAVNLSNTVSSRLYFGATGTYEHNVNGGNIPTATWDNTAPGSTCSIIGWVGATATPAGLTPPGGFSNFTWNSPGQTGTPNLDGTLQLVNRRLTITSTGTNKVNLSDGGTPNLTVGEILIDGGRLANNNGNAFQTIYCNGNFTISSGLYEMNAIGAAASYTYIRGDLIHTGGTISRTGGNQYFEFNGTSGTQNLTVTNPANVTGAVNFRLNNPGGLQVTTGSTFPINGGAVLQITQGNVTTIGTAAMSYGTSGGLATLLYDPTGSIAITTKDEWPLTGMRKVRINSVSSQPIVLNASRTMDASSGTTILFDNGRLSLGAYDLIISNSESTAVVPNGGYAETNGTGQLIRYLLSSNSHIYDFPVGIGSNYTLANYFFYTNSLANRQLGVRAVAGTHPQMNNPAIPTSYLANRYWATTLNDQSGSYSYSVTYYFKTGDEMGTPADIRLSHWNGYSWINATNSAVSGSNIYSTMLTQYTGTLANGAWTGRIFKVPITYTWNLANSGSWIVNSNWNPIGVPGSQDIVLFTHPGNYTVNNVPADVDFGRMLFSGGGTTTLMLASAGNIYFSGGGSPVFKVDAGTTAIFSGNIPSNWIVLSGSTGSVSGNVQLRGTTGTTAHTLQAEDAGGLSFEPGSNFYAGVLNTTNFSGSPFGSGGTDETVVFKNGSTFEQFDGANPFGTSPSNKVIFQTGSLYRFSNNDASSQPSFSGRSYANFEFNSSQNKSASGGSAFNMENLTVTQGTFNINMTGTPGHSITGNITVASGAGLNFSPLSAGTVLLNGIAKQTISGSGLLTLGSNATLQISNTSGGVDLAKDITVNGTMSVASNGILNAKTTYVAAGTGTFNLLSDGILGVGSPDGLFSVANTGNIQTTTRAFSSSGIVRFNGSVAQNSGNFTTAPTTNTLKALHISNPTGVSLSTNNNNITVSTLGLESGSFAIGAGQQVNISAGGLVNATTGDFATGSTGGTVFFGSTGSFSGNANPFNVRIQGLVNFGAGTVTIQDGGTFRIDQNGGVVSNAPYYATGSTLQYSANEVYQRFLEWNATSGRGSPHHVRLTNNTTLNPARSGGSYANTPFVCNGNLTIELGNSLSMNHSGNNMTVPLEIGGNILIEGNLSGSQISGGDIKVAGNWTRQGAGNYFPNNRAVFFNGSNPGTIYYSNGSETFAYLVVDKGGSAANTLTLTSPIYINNKLTLTSGRIITSLTNILTIVNGFPDDAANGVAVASYDGNPGFVDGPMQRKIQNTSAGESYLFPVGKTNGTNYYYKRFKLRDVQNSTGADYFRAEYIRAQPPGSADYFFGSNLHGILSNEYWNINRLSGTAEGRLVLPYADPGAGGWLNVLKSTAWPFTNANVGVVRGAVGNPGEYNWDFTGPDSATFSNIGPEPQGRFYENSGDVKSRLITEFSPFTIGFGFNAILPVNLLSFTAFLHDVDAHLTWKLADVTGLKHSELEHSMDGQQFKQLAILALHDDILYSYKHVNPGPGVHYYRLQLVDRNGHRSQSKTEVLMVNTNRTLVTGLLQNPIRGGQAVVRMYSATNQAAESMLLDMMGKTLLRQKHNLVAGYNQPIISLLLLPAGMYKLVMRTEDGVEQVTTVIK